MPADLPCCITSGNIPFWPPAAAPGCLMYNELIELLPKIEWLTPLESLKYDGYASAPFSGEKQARSGAPCDPSSPKLVCSSFGGPCAAASSGGYGKSCGHNVACGPFLKMRCGETSINFTEKFFIINFKKKWKLKYH